MIKWLRSLEASAILSPWPSPSSSPSSSAAFVWGFVSQLRKAGLKKFRLKTGFEPMRSAIPVLIHYCDELSVAKNVYSAAQVIIRISYIPLISSPSTGILRTHKWPAPSWLDSSVSKSAAPVSQRSWVRIPFKPVFLSGLLFSTA